MEGIKPPIVALNFKAYKEATGEGAKRLSEIAEKVSEETGICVIVAVQPTDLYRVARKVKIPVFAQHVDPVGPGSYTGHVTSYAVKKSGAKGSLVNHSEMRLKLADIAAVLEALRSDGLASLLCTDTVSTSAAGAALGPDMLAVEPPELIGTGIPVSKARPEVVSGTVERVREVNERVVVLCGAGISSAEDVHKAIELGSEGVLLASAYVKSSEPEKLLREMCEQALRAYESRV